MIDNRVLFSIQCCHFFANIYVYIYQYGVTEQNMYETQANFGVFIKAAFVRNSSLTATFHCIAKVISIHFGHKLCALIRYSEKNEI